jgi:hypothetical protein
MIIYKNFLNLDIFENLTIQPLSQIKLSIYKNFPIFDIFENLTIQIKRNTTNQPRFQISTTKIITHLDLKNLKTDHEN